MDATRASHGRLGQITLSSGTRAADTARSLTACLERITLIPHHSLCIEAVSRR